MEIQRNVFLVWQIRTTQTIMKADVFRKGNTHSLANMIVRKTDIFAARNATKKMVARTGAVQNQMNADWQCTEKIASLKKRIEKLERMKFE